MKQITLLLILLISYSKNSDGQTIKGVLNITNAKPNMYLYGLFSSSIFHYFYGVDDKVTIHKYDIPTEVNLDSIGNDFKKYVSLSFLSEKCFFNDKQNLKYEKNKVWIEKTVYTYNIQTKKINYLYQIVIEFEGLVPGTEDASYKIKDISCKRGVQTVRRDAFIKALKYDFSIFDEMPPPIMEFKK